MALDHALTALQNVEESKRLDMAVAVVVALIHAGLRERAIQLVNEVGNEERRDVKRAAIRTLVKTQGLLDTLAILGQFEGQPDEARWLLHDAALELPSRDADALRDLARSLTDPSARAIALAGTVASGSCSITSSARSLLEEAERDFAKITEPQARHRIAVGLARAWATAGRLREAFDALPRQSPEEFVEQLARWPQGLSLLKESIPVLSWVCPGWREIAELLSDGSRGSTSEE
jgi:hypothetical protein